ncbi:MAG TPA: NAD+ synthase [Limnochordia bacterium]|mgnify:CR=1 FL=1|nr:NAD+ synthase [Limnochordia bacterium]
MRIYLAQENPVVGDLWGNLARLRQVVQDNGACDLIVFPELYLTGYPPCDLLLRGEFLEAVREAARQLQEFSAQHPSVTLVMGTPWQEREQLFSAALVVRGGVLLGIQYKRRLTPFRFFPEARYFHPGQEHLVVPLAGRALAVALGLELDGQLARELKDAGADLVVNPRAVPFRVGEEKERLDSLAGLASSNGLTVAAVGQVGGNDGLIFPGASRVWDSQGRLLAALPRFQKAGQIVDLSSPGEPPGEDLEEDAALVYQALVLGLRDYAAKCGMKRVIIGLSGGIDSAVAACIAAEALGPQQVWGLTQPGPYSAPESARDAQALARNLGLRFDVLPITGLYQSMLTALGEHFAGTEMNVAEENIQARLRGSLLMALSNKFGGLVLSNSNKSELAVGYCTLYGDMCGGLAVLADVYKTMVYQLAEYINREREIIPWNTIKRPPSAELRPNQRDEDSLPPYAVLDAILAAYLDEGLSPREIMARGYAEETVRWVVKTVEASEYKRRQAALMLRVTTPLFGSERRMPLAAVKML